MELNTKFSPGDRVTHHRMGNGIVERIEITSWRGVVYPEVKNFVRFDDSKNKDSHGNLFWLRDYELMKIPE